MSTITLLEKIFTWSEDNLAPWAKDAVRRLFEKNSQLDNADYDELLALLKKEHGIEPDDEISPKPLSKAHLPATQPDVTTFKILAMRNLCHVNRIPSDQKINFAENGLTIIYGGNGTGKSGYARVLKKACRARDTEDILPDLTVPSNAQCVTSATFDVKVNGFENVLAWSNDQPSPDLLSMISVFDSRCARIIIDDKQEIEYVPYGLDVLGNLATQVYPKITQQLDNEIKNIVSDNSSFKPFINDTIAGKFAGSVNADTSIESIEKILIFTSDDERRLDEITAQLTETDPISKAKEHHRYYERLKAMICNIDAFNDKAISEQCQNTETLCNEYNIAKAEEKVAASNFRADEELLPGTGESVWKELFEAARKFSEIAYKEHVFPNLNEDSLCPLCQNPLEGGLERLKRFDEYIKRTTSQKVQKKNHEIVNYRKHVETMSYSIDIDRSLLEDNIIDKELENLIKNFEADLKQFQTHILDALDTRIWTPAPKIFSLPVSKLRSLAAQQLCEERKYRRLSSENNIAKLKQDQQELSTRKNLYLHKDSIQKYVNAAKRTKLLEKCRKSLDTGKISNQVKKMSQDAITDDLRSALSKEFKYFGLGLNVTLKDFATKGRINLQLHLDFLKRNEVKIRDILSEGEQRAIALGAFLAEINLSANTGGIVFDDPVSSLDHEKRDKVARRLVEESHKRQVIIFTHDTVFLSLLQNEADNNDVKIVHLEHHETTPGHVRDGLPWIHKSCRDKIDKLSKRINLLAPAWQPYPSDEQSSKMRNLYSDLRATIELMVQNDVLNRVVQRYDNWIRVKNLEGVIGFNKSEYDKIYELYEKCSGVTSAHDSPSAANLPVPDPDEFRNDLNQILEILSIIKSRKNKPKS
jgi:energy-coupling factor transporter ATP-binding protein EcfA2